MQVGVGWWLMFEDRWAAVLRFLPRFSFFALQFFVLQFALQCLRCKFFCAAALFGC